MSVQATVALTFLGFFPFEATVVLTFDNFFPPEATLVLTFGSVVRAELPPLEVADDRSTAQSLLARHAGTHVVHAILWQLKQRKFY